jgi:hypothetical protein
MGRRAPLVIAAVVFVVAGVVVAGIVGFPREPTGRASSRPAMLPGDLESLVFDSCIPEADVATLQGGVTGIEIGTSYDGAFQVDIENPGSWSVEVGRRGAHVTTQGGVDALSGGSPAARAVALAQEMYDCMKGYRFIDPSTLPTSSSQLLQLYKYDTTVLWPCLRGIGLDPGFLPTRADFATSSTAQNVSPYRSMDPQPGELKLLVASAQLCPSRPAYLSAGGD